SCEAVTRASVGPPGAGTMLATHHRASSYESSGGPMEHRDANERENRAQPEHQDHRGSEGDRDRVQRAVRSVSAGARRNRGTVAAAGLAASSIAMIAGGMNPDAEAPAQA